MPEDLASEKPVDPASSRPTSLLECAALYKRSLEWLSAAERERDHAEEAARLADTEVVRARGRVNDACGDLLRAARQAGAAARTEP